MRQFFKKSQVLNSLGSSLPSQITLRNFKIFFLLGNVLSTSKSCISKGALGLMNHLKWQKIDEVIQVTIRYIGIYYCHPEKILTLKICSGLGVRVLGVRC